MKSLNTKQDVSKMKDKEKKKYWGNIQDELKRIAQRTIDEIFVDEELNAHEAMATAKTLMNLIEEKWKQYEEREMRDISIADLVKDLTKEDNE